MYAWALILLLLLPRILLPTPFNFLTFDNATGANPKFSALETGTLILASALFIVRMSSVSPNRCLTAVYRDLCQFRPRGQSLSASAEAAEIKHGARTSVPPCQC